MNKSDQYDMNEFKKEIMNDLNNDIENCKKFNSVWEGLEWMKDIRKEK